MSSSDKMKNKLMSSMRATKEGTATTTEAEAPKAPAKAEAPAKKPAATKAPARKKAASTPAATGFSSGCRVWPD